MPKKTKKQKIIAAYHKKLKLLQNIIPEHKNDNEKKIADESINNQTNSRIKTVKTNQIIIDNRDIKNRQYFFADFRKSIIVIFFIFALEIFLYFATINNYFNLKIGF